MVLHVKNGQWQQPKRAFVKQGDIWKPIRAAYVRNADGWRRYYAAERVALIAGDSQVISDYFLPEDWSDPNIHKIAVVPEGREIGANYVGHALATSHFSTGKVGSWAGDLTINNYGTISGQGGNGNGGVGGTAFLGTYPGLSDQRARLNNYGIIRGGGGGGGRGGNGANGYWNDYQYSPNIYEYEHSCFALNWGNNTQKFWWGGRLMWGPASFDRNNVQNNIEVEGWVYTRNQYFATAGGWEYLFIARRLARPNRVSTRGGIGGEGGQGTGYRAAAQAGRTGTVGGTNAGSGGTGGSGGGWGAAGEAGRDGGGGNDGNPTAAGAGGLPGFCVQGASNVILNNFGTVLGRIG